MISSGILLIPCTYLWDCFDLLAWNDLSFRGALKFPYPLQKNIPERVLLGLAQECISNLPTVVEWFESLGFGHYSTNRGGVGSKTIDFEENGYN